VRCARKVGLVARLRVGIRFLHGALGGDATAERNPSLRRNPSLTRRLISRKLAGRWLPHLVEVTADEVVFQLL